MNQTSRSMLFGKSSVAAPLLAFAAGMLFVAAPASADWIAVYDLTSDVDSDGYATALVTPNPLGDQIDLAVRSGEVAQWSDGATQVTAPNPPATSVNFNGDMGATYSPGDITPAVYDTAVSGSAPNVTYNKLVVKFYGGTEVGGIASVPDDAGIEVLLYDAYFDMLTRFFTDFANPDTLVPMMWGQNDTTMVGQLGVLDGEGAGGVTWGVGARGLVHQELLCDDYLSVVPPSLCGLTSTIPADDEILIDHNLQSHNFANQGQYPPNPPGADTAAAESAGTVFAADFSTMTGEVVVQPYDSGDNGIPGGLDDLGRIWHDVDGTLVSALWSEPNPLAEVPTMSTWHLVFLGLGLLTVAIPVLMHGRARSAA